MPSLHLRKIWKISETLLRRAREALSIPTAETEKRFNYFDEQLVEYLEFNEHELALDMPEEMGLLVEPRGGFWKDLKKAAKNMGLDERIPFFESEFDRAIQRITPSEEVTS